MINITDLFKLINWSELSRLLVGDRGNLRPNKISPKHFAALDDIFLVKIPEWWKNHKAKLIEEQKNKKATD